MQISKARQLLLFEMFKKWYDNKTEQFCLKKKQNKNIFFKKKKLFFFKFGGDLQDISKESI